MGKNTGNSWLNAKRGKKRWIFRRHFSLETTIQHNAGKCADSKAVRICSGEDNLVRKKTENSATEQRRAFAVAMATTAQAAAEIVRLTRPALLVKEDKAALLIQQIFRGYLARKALLALRGVVKLQALIRGHNVRTRAKMTLQCIQSLVRVQALVCDQRRRLSCEAMSLGSMFSHDSNERKSMSKNMSRVSSSLDVDPMGIEEIHALIQKAKECSLKQGQTLAQALSQQIWTKEEDQSSDQNHENEQHSWIRKDRNLCNQIKTVEVDTSRPYSLTPPTKTRDHEQYIDSMFTPTPLHGKRLNLYVQSPRTPSSSKTKSIPCSPCYHRAAETPTSRSLYIHRMSMSENSCPLPRPNYMAATASAIARVRPCSTPRQRLSSPSRDLAGSARKRLSFPVHDGHNADDKTNFLRCRGSQFDDEQRSDMPYYAKD
ncbi:hypothetical protein C2S51_025390 [Perilla frutescens var. frutescens]|nr:hypothetical protein C2S51_025390 [Perilla frutescens var. frutescens]